MALEDLIAELLGGNDERAEGAIAGLVAYGRQAVNALTPTLNDPDPDRRWWAARALAEIDDPQVPALLVVALEDEDLAVRQCAALALRRQPHGQAVPALIKALHSRDSLMAGLAGDALTSIGVDAVPALLDVMKNAPQAARLVAVRALALIGDQRSIPALYEALSEDSMMMEYWANEGLERMGVGMAFFKP